jgi:hypothetical protein
MPLALPNTPGTPGGNEDPVPGAFPFEALKGLEGSLNGLLIAGIGVGVSA